MSEFKLQVRPHIKAQEDMQAKADAFDWIAEHCQVEAELDNGFYIQGERHYQDGSEAFLPWKSEPMTLLQWVEREKGVDNKSGAQNNP